MPKAMIPTSADWRRIVLIEPKLKNSGCGMPMASTIRTKTIISPVSSDQRQRSKESWRGSSSIDADDQPLETGAGELRPDLRRRRRTACEIEEIDLERIGQRRGVHVPVMQVEAASEAQHDVADLLAVPQLTHHLVRGRIF